MVRFVDAGEESFYYDGAGLKHPKRRSPFRSFGGV